MGSRTYSQKVDQKKFYPLCHNSLYQSKVSFKQGCVIILARLVEAITPGIKISKVYTLVDRKPVRTAKFVAR